MSYLCRNILTDQTVLLPLLAQDVSRSAAWFTSLACWAGGAAAIKKSDIAGAYIYNRMYIYIYNHHIYIYRI